MDYHGITMKGPFSHEILVSLPTWTTNDIGREIYVQNAVGGLGGYYKGISTGWLLVSTADHTHTGVYLPVGGKAADSELLDGIDSTQYARRDVANTFAADQDHITNKIIRAEIKNYSESYLDTGTGTAYTFDLTNGNTFRRQISGNTAFTFPQSGLVAGKVYSFTLMLVNGGSYTITFPGSVKWTNNTPPTLGANSTALMDVLTFFTIDAGTTWYGCLAIKKIGV